jgi:uncharacterized RDD family membrane protein YckC
LVTNQRQYAGLGPRFLALMVDFLIFCVLFFPITRIFKGVWIMSSADHLWGYGWLVTDPLCITFLLIMVLYFILLEGLTGFTIGKKVAGLRVIGTHGDRPGLRRATVRNLLRIVDALPALNILGIVLIARSPERTRFGDRVANTRVIRE